MDNLLKTLNTVLHPINQLAKDILPTAWPAVAGFTVFFGVVFVLSFILIRYIIRQDRAKSALLASCCMSSIHGFVCATTGFMEICSWRAFELDALNSPSQLMLIQFSLAYMIADFAFYLVIFDPWNYLFVVHHIISALFLVGVLQTGVAAISGIIMFFMGEITSPLLNAFTFAKEFRHQSKFANKVFLLLSPLFTFGYILVRSIIAPPLVGWFCYSFWTRALRVPLAWRVPMGGVVAIGIVASQAWTVLLIKGFRSQKRKMKTL